MLDFQSIQKLFGTPLNSVLIPNSGFKIKPWHIFAVVVGGYVVYRGMKSIQDDGFPEFISDNKKRN